MKYCFSSDYGQVCVYLRVDLNSTARVGQLLERYTNITQTPLGLIRLNLHLNNRPLFLVRLYHLSIQIVKYYKGFLPKYVHHK